MNDETKAALEKLDRQLRLLMLLIELLKLRARLVTELATPGGLGR